MRLNRVYVVVLRVGGQEFRQRRFTWSRARAQRWATKIGGGCRVEETRLV